MNHELTIALLAGVGAMLGWGIADFFAKKAIDTIGDVATLFWNQLLGIIPLAIIFLLRPEAPHFGISGFVILIILGAWSGLAYIPTYTAFGKGKVSLISPIFASYAVLVTILSAVFFKEIIPFWRQIAFVVVFFGILLINGDPRDWLNLLRGKERKHGEKILGLKEILLAIFIYSFWLIALDQFIDGRYWVPFLLVIRIFSAITLYFYAYFKKISLKVIDSSLWKYLCIIGLFDVAAFAFVAFGYSKTSYVSIVTMLSGAFSLPTILLGRIFLKEKSTRLQAIGSIIVIIGIMLLAIL